MIPINLSDPIWRQRVLNFLRDRRNKKNSSYSGIVHKFVSVALHFTHEICCISYAVPYVAEALIWMPSSVTASERIEDFT